MAGYTPSISPVVGDASAATANTARIQAFVNSSAKGGVITGQGDVYINDTISVPDGATLKTAKGCRLRLAPGANKAPVITAPVNVASAAVTVAWTAGKFATVTWTGHGLSLGDWIVLQGATELDWWNIYQVYSITDANTVVITLPFRTAAAPTGSITARRCIRNVDIDVEVDYDYTNNPSGNALNRMAVVAAFVANSKIRVRAKNVYKYALLLGGVANVEADAGTYPDAHSDTLKVYGPYSNVRATAHGIGAEDCASSQALEPTEFIAYMPCRGNGRKLRFEELDAAVTTAGSGPLVIYTDDSFSQESIEVVGGELRGGGGNTPAFYVRPGNTFTAAQSKLKDVTIRGTRLQNADDSVIQIEANMRTLRIDGAKFVSPDSDTVFVIRVAAGAVVDELIVENIEFDGGIWPVAAISYFIEIIGGTVRNLVLRNCSFRGSSSFFRLIRVNNTGGCAQITLDNCEADSIDALVRIDATPTIVPIVTIRGGRYKGVHTGVNARYTGVKVILDGVYFEDMNLGAVRSELAGVNTEIHERGCTFVGTSLLFTCVSTATVDIKSQSSRVNIGTTGVNKTAGNACFSTTAQGTIPANTPVMADGTNWFSLKNPSLVF